MNPSEITEQITGWFEQNRRDFPWRQTEDPYEVWVSEIMLQQTRATTVEDYYEEFLKEFPTVEQLAEAERDEVLKQWEGMGFYARARRLHKTAGKIVTEYGGRLPEAREELEALPGIGDYTASVLRALIYDHPDPVVDGNVERVLARYGAIESPVERADTQSRIRNRLEQWLQSAKSPGTISEALMELGAVVCTPGMPDCESCPLQPGCEAENLGIQEAVPNRRSNDERPHVDRLSAFLEREQTILLRRRPEDVMLGGLWELPGPVIREGDDFGNRLKNYLERQLRTEVSVADPVHTREHTYSHLEETLRIFPVQEVSRLDELPENWKWVPRDEFDSMAMPGVYHQFREELLTDGVQ